MNDLFGDPIQRAIDLLRMYQPKDRLYYGCFSGGKDSVVIKEICEIGKIPVEWHYNVTTIDPPELTRFIKQYHSDVTWEIPKENFFSMAERRGFPTRRARWCCEEFKESRTPKGATMIFGVRKKESPRRAKLWKEVTAHTKTHAYVISPIVDWSNEQVWRFIRSRNLPYCSLYDEGFKRLGCIGCPMSSNIKYEFYRWPHFERRWRNLFKRIWENRSGKLQRDGRIWVGERFWNSADEMFEWWVSGDPYPKDDECQGILEYYS